MLDQLDTLHGVIHGKTIELDSPTGLPDGQEVSVVVRPKLRPEERLRRAFGGWAEDAEELDEFLKQLRHDRGGRSTEAPQ